MSRKVLGWNINQRSGLGKEIPELVFQELLAQEMRIQMRYVFYGKQRYISC